MLGIFSAAIPDGEASSVVCVNLGDRFDPNVNFIFAYGGKGIRHED